MFKRYKFVALLVCLCVFSFGIAGSACATDVTFTASGTANCSTSFLAALAMATGKEKTATEVKITNIESITALTFANGQISATGSTEFTATSGVPITEITDLKGIELFTALTALDVSGCTALTTLDVSDIPGIVSSKAYESYGKKFLYPESLATGNQVTNSKPKFYAKRLILGESLSMPFYIELAGNDPATTNTAEAMSGSTMTFTIDHPSDENGTQTKTFAQDDAYFTDYLYKNWKYSATKDDTENYTDVTHYGFTCALTSIQMADTITASFKLSGSSTNDAEITYTVKEYLDRLIQYGTEGSKLVNLAKAVKDYGHYAQIELNATESHTKMDNAAGKVTTDEGYSVTFYNNETTETIKTKLASSYQFSKGTFTGDVGYTLNLGTKIDLIVTLPTDTTINSVSRVDAEDTTNTAKTLTKDTDYTVDESKKTITIPNLAAHQLADKFTINATPSGGSASDIIVYGLSYVNSVMKASNLSDLGLTSGNLDDLKNVSVALYNFYDAETKYRANPNN